MQQPNVAIADLCRSDQPECDNIEDRYAMPTMSEMALQTGNHARGPAARTQPRLHTMADLQHDDDQHDVHNQREQLQQNIVRGPCKAIQKCHFGDRVA